MSVEIKKHLDLLGLSVKDRVTEFEGVVTSISFDLYGCIQADVRPVGKTPEGKLIQGYWFDVNRLAILDESPVMDIPDFNYEKGASDKSSMKA